MCGIAGVWGQPGHSGSNIVRDMTDALSHRGPDDQGQWFDVRAGITLGHRRLSILDTSSAGHQPMASPSGRYVMVFNGEVYNFDDVRRELPDVHWRGHSDTEVMLAAFEMWGLEEAVKKFIGMFAFALWDSVNRELFLVRDRLGIKPLFYTSIAGSILFGSELKAFRSYPGFNPRVNVGALALLMRHNYIPHPYCIYEGVHKLPPGSILRVGHDRQLAHPTPFWNATHVAESAANNMLPDDPVAVLEECNRLLLDATRLRMISDVPIGAFLSGGIDSSLVVALMQAQSSRPIRTFSIGFAEAAYNEAPFAEGVARHLGTDHTELCVTPREAQSTIPKIPELFDEPFADSSQIPTYLVSALARKHVTVSLSGDGGDELFAGYPRYGIATRLWDFHRWTPRPFRRMAAGSLRSLSADSWSALFRTMSGILPDSLNRRRPGEQMHRLADLIEQDSPEAMYHSILSHWSNTRELVRNSTEPSTIFTDPQRLGKLSTFTSRMMLTDVLSYLPDDILTKVDRASMAVSLEARVPLLDHRVAEFAFRVPISVHLREGKPKWLLRKILDKHVPRNLVDRPKMGFAMPVGDWLRGPLRDWGESLLSRKCLAEEGFFDVDMVRDCWEKHLTGARNFQYQLWNLLMFQAWLHIKKERVDVRLGEAKCGAISG